jgi:NAD+ kinase
VFVFSMCRGPKPFHSFISPKTKFSSLLVSHSLHMTKRWQAHSILLVKKERCNKTLQACEEILVWWLAHVREPKVYLESSVYHNELGAFAATDERVCVFDCSRTPFPDVCIVLGGDGSVLHAYELFPVKNQPRPPMLCFGMGTLNFLSQFGYDQWQSVLPGIADVCPESNAGPYMELEMVDLHHLVGSIMDVEEHTDADADADADTDTGAEAGAEAEAEAETEAEDAKGMTKKLVTRSKFHALNEIVISRGEPLLMSLDLFVNGEEVTTLLADGLIIAPPLGSTAYSMSAGGPLVSPTLPAITITPICPHTLSFRPLVLPANVNIDVRISNSSRVGGFVTYDGRLHSRTRITRGQMVRIHTAQHPMPFVVCPNRGFLSLWFGAIKHKLHWNHGASNIIASKL